MAIDDRAAEEGADVHHGQSQQTNRRTQKFH